MIEKRRPQKFRKEFCQIVDQWRRSGLTKDEFCQQNDYSLCTFNHWIEKEKKFLKVVSPTLVPLQIHDYHTFELSSGFEVEYPNGVRLRLNALPGNEELSRIIHIYGELCFH